MNFHTKTVELLERLFPLPRLDAELASLSGFGAEFARLVGPAELQARCASSGLPVPAALADWYAKPDSVRILRLLSNDDWPLYPSEFTALEGEPDDLLLIMNENQGVCFWATRFDGTDDPPVFVRSEQYGAPWYRYSESFSDFVYSMALDWGFARAAAEVYHEDCEPIDEEELDALLLEDHVRGPISIEMRGTRTVRYIGRDSFVKVTGLNLLAASLNSDTHGQLTERLSLYY